MDNTILQKGLNMGLNLFNAATMIFKSKKLYHSYIEAISNSIDSIKERLQSGEQFTPKIDIIFFTDNNIIHSIKIIDNGIGFNTKNFKSFQTVFSDNKFLYGGKGCGHLSWIVEAKGAKINSTYIDSDKQYSNIRFTFDKNFESNNDLEIVTNITEELKTEIALYDIVDLTSDKQEALIKNIISTFFNIFLEDSININFTINDNTIVLNEYFKNNVIYTYDDETIKTEITNNEIQCKDITTNIIRVRKDFIRSSKIILSADNRAVVELDLNEYIPMIPKTLIFPNSTEYCIILLCESDLFNQRVNHDRHSFINIGKKAIDTIENNDFPYVSYSQLFDNLLDKLKMTFKDDIEQYNNTKHNMINNIINDNPSLHYITNNGEILSKLSDKDLSSESTLRNKLNDMYRQEKNKVGKFIDDAREILKENDNYEEFYTRIKQQIPTITNIANHELANYVAYRKTIIDLMDDFTKINMETNNSENENIFHQLIFPMREEDCINTNNINYYKHNLWLVDEKLSFYYTIASDKKFQNISFIESSSSERADLLVAMTNNQDDITAFVLVEFKKPKRNNYNRIDNPIAQIVDYSKIIKNGKFNKIICKNGKEYKEPITIPNNIPFYAYIIADITSTLSDLIDEYELERFKGQSGIEYCYGTVNKIHITIKPYKTIIKEAKLNNRAFFDMLGI